MSLIKQLLIIMSAIALGALAFLLSQPPAAQGPVAIETPSVVVEQPSEPQTPVAEPVSAGPSIAGLWLGALDVGGGQQLRILLKVTGEQGVLSATLDSIDQNAFDLAIDEITVADGILKFVMSQIGVSYEGTLSTDGTQIVGTWKQDGAELPLNFAPVKEAPGKIRRPQDPIEPFPYIAEVVKFSNDAAGIEFAGTLTKPSEGGPFAAVVLVTGSGPEDRNEEVFNHRPFLVLADYLTRNGIAVLRYDERGVGQSGGEFSGATSEDFAADATAAFHYLQTRSDINPTKIGIIGHSEGGLIAPMVASQNPDVAFIVMLAGPGIPGDQIILLQSALIARANGVSEAVIQRDLAITKSIFEIVKSEPNANLARDQLRQLLTEYAASLSEEERSAMGYSEAAIEQQIEQALSPWFRYFLSYDPAPTLAQVKCPVLALNGEHDLQVPAHDNLLAISNALEAGGNSDYAIVKLPALNHLFQTSTTGSPSEYQKIEETFAPIALKTIADWIIGHISIDF